MSTTRVLRDHALSVRRPLAIFAAWSVLEAAPPLVSGLAVARMVDAALRGDFTRSFLWLAVLGSAYIAATIASRNTVRGLALIVEPLRDSLARRVVDAALHRALGRAGASPRAARAQDPALTHLTVYVEMVRETMGSGLIAVRNTGLVLVSALIGLSTLVPLFALFTAVSVAGALLVLWSQVRAVHLLQSRVVIAKELIASRAEDLVLGSRDILACGAKERIYAEVAQAVDAEASLTRSLARAGVARGLVMAIGGYLPIGCALIAAPELVRAGRLDASGLIGSLLYLFAYVAPTLRAITQSMMSVGVPMAVTLTRLLKSTEIPPTASGAPATDQPYSRFPTLAFDRVTYTYGPQSDPILQEFSASIAPHEFLAVVGTSGVGKSTFADLLAGLTEPSSGRVLVDGRSLNSTGKASARSIVTLVPQEAYLFTGTIRQNLAYLRPGVTEDELLNAVHEVGATALLAACPEGLATELRGDTLSMGERQLLTLVRTWVSEAPIVVLDEATSSLDPASVATVERAFRRRRGTLVVIAHDLGSALRADRVMFMEGRQTFLGTHDELYGTAPGYATLIDHWSAATRTSP